jgi:hypothetical protein
MKDNKKIIESLDKFIVGTNKTAAELVTQAKELLEKADSYQN